ncbi:MAG: GNAT family N-acetyltransferase [Thermoplasmatota archaeon]
MFEIGKIRFRPFGREDISLLEKWENDYEVTLYARGKPLVFKNTDNLEKEYEEYLKDEDKQRFILEMVKDDKTLGIATYKGHSDSVKNADIGVYIGEKEYWNQGIGKDITLGLCEMLLFHKNYDRLSAWSSSLNKRAHKVLEEFGFVKTGVARKSGYLLGNRIDWLMFDLLKEEYMTNRQELLDKHLDDKEKYLRNYCKLKVPKKYIENKKQNDE